MKVLMTVLALGLMAIASAEAQAAQCKVELQNGRGRVLEVFRAHGYSKHEACRYAKQDCRQVKRAGYYRAPVQRCVEQQQWVTRTCQVEMVNRRGMLIKMVNGQASGVKGQGVKAQACSKALNKCYRQKERMGRYGATCHSPLMGRGYSSGPVYTPRNNGRNHQGPVVVVTPPRGNGGARGNNGSRGNGRRRN